MFSGEFQHSIDAKGRVIIPAKFREQLGEKFIVTKGFDQSLFVFSSQEWEKFYEKLSTLPMTDPNTRAFSRRFLAGAVECEPDKQGRVLIPPHLREYAQITSDVTITGNGNKAEIWSTEVWNQYIEAIDADEIAANMGNLGIFI